MRRTNTRTLCAVGVSLAALMGASAAVAQTAPAPQAAAQDVAQDDGAATVDDIVVTGFRSSLQQALSIKRREAGAVDAILAEDMADFPDQNLAEAIQRLPGVTIDRVNGQGTTISVRGLGSDFTRTRINGLEAQAASGGNRNRSFDFSMFASELFNSIKVRKTQSAEIEEGSLGATVDLQTGRPLDFGGSGLNSALSVQASYNDLSEKTVPRLAGLLSWSNEDRTFGALISVAYSERSPILGSFNTTRWQSGAINPPIPAGKTRADYPNYPYGLGQNFASCIPCTTTAQRDALLSAYYPRIPRYTLGNTQEDRLGMTGALQWRPSDRTEAVLDVLWSRFNSELESPNIEAWAFSRANVNNVVVRDYAIDVEKNILSYGVFDNMLVRAENGFTRNESNFYQASLNVRHDFTRRLNGAGGALKGIEIQYQQPFTFLPGLWSNFGFTGNVTWVDSEVSYGTAGKNRLTGQSKNTANATLYYEDGPFQARVSVAHRSQYLLSFPGANGNSEEGVNDTTNIDASMSYEFTPNLTFSLEGINLTDEYTDRYVDVSDRVSDYRHTGREIAVGLRWKY